MTDFFLNNLVKKNIKIGINAGKIDQGEFSIAIGNNAGVNTQKNKTIILNANDQELNSDVSNAFYVKPIRNTEGTSLLQYDNSNGEISYSNSISTNLSLNCNLLNDVSGINFCDGTYIGQGNSFDISTNEIIKINQTIGTTLAINQNGDYIFLDGKGSTNIPTNLNSVGTEKIQTHVLSSSGASAGFYCYDSSISNSARLEFYKNESGSVNSNTDISSNSIIGYVGFRGMKNNSYSLVSRMIGGTTNSNSTNLEGNIFFQTKELNSALSTKMVISGNGNIGINTTQPLCSLDVNRTDAIKLPSGTTVQRPSNPVGGMIRYNTQLNSVEWYDAGNQLWNNFVGVIATGGSESIITQNDIEYRVHTFTTVGTSSFNVLNGGYIEYLIIGGGGSSGSTVGNGGNSSFGPITSIGGGAGRIGTSEGNNGGSGGGAGGNDGSRNGGTGTAGQGFNGGAGAGSVGDSDNRAGGGGGAGAAGTLGPVVNGIGVGGNGGNGIQSNITGTLTYRGGGGCGTGHATGGGSPGTAGLGGGGGKNTPGAPNTGGGAGGSSEYEGGGGAGGYRCSVQGELSGQNTSAESRFKVIEQQYSVVVGNGGAGSVLGGSGIVIIRYPIYKNSIFGYPQ